jgi:hypothetical protein
MTKQHVRPRCKTCGTTFSLKRFKAGYKVCMPCGEESARTVQWCIAPMHKSNYVLITNTSDLAGLNNKGGLVK